jgi:hypothetical protein
MDGWIERHDLPSVHLHIMQRSCNDHFIFIQETGTLFRIYAGDKTDDG